MRKRVAMLLALAVLGTGAPLHAQGADDDADAVRAAARGFKDALIAGDAEKALSYLHPAVLIFEGGHGETRDDYAGGHLGADMAFLAAVPPTVVDDDVLVEGDLALYTSESTSEGEFRGREIRSRSAETMVLVRTDEGWWIRHIHWSSGRR